MPGYEEAGNDIERLSILETVCYCHFGVGILSLVPCSKRVQIWLSSCGTLQVLDRSSHGYVGIYANN